MPESGAVDHGGPYVEAGFKEIEIVAYLGEFKIVGTAHFGIGGRATSRMKSEDTQELLETAPFVLLNMEKVDFIYARDEEDGAVDPA